MKLKLQSLLVQLLKLWLDTINIFVVVDIKSDIPSLDVQKERLGVLFLALCALSSSLAFFFVPEPTFLVDPHLAFPFPKLCCARI